VVGHVSSGTVNRNLYSSKTNLGGGKVDRKTLEYMEERAKKARRIVVRVEDLNAKLAKAKKADYFTFSANQHGYYVEEREFHLVESMKINFEKVLAEEIERLEKELAEL
jgi:molecular chaperone DnaK (HSP70)